MIDIHSVNLTPFVELAIAVCAGLITRCLIPWLQEKKGRERVEKLYRQAKIGVEAAEQLYGAGCGPDIKLPYVKNYLQSRGFELDEESVRTAIEAAVYEINNAVLTVPAELSEIHAD